MIALYGHPFSSYTQKALIAFYERGTAFDYRSLDDDGSNFAALKALWPLAKFPLLTEGETTVFEATAIIEYLEAAHPGPARLIPEDPLAAVRVRMLDRVFDNYVMTPMNAFVQDAMRPPAQRDALNVDAARALLDQIYPWLDEALGPGEWAAGEAFTLADCAAAPSLFYADWVHPIPHSFPRLRAYRQGLLARPAVARAVDEARPYRHLFPPGAPDRD
jgi:glutathione S-transferase